ncbi:MAG: DMT family transporter [Bacillota bacterium]|nr:DMT family transporter [Bacillota bacterium]
MNSSHKGMLYMLLSAFLLSTSGIFIKIVHAEPLAIVALRSGIAGLTLLPFLRIKQIKFHTPTIIYIFAYAVMVVTFVTATKYTTSANTVALQYTGSLYLYIYSVFTKKIKVQFGNVIPMLFILIGISAFLLEPNKGHSLTGNILAIISGISLATMFGILPKIKDISPVSLVCISNLTTFIVVFPLILSLNYNIALNIQGWTALIYLGVVQVALSYILNAKGVQLISPLAAMVLSMVDAVMNPIWVFIFIGETPTNYGFVGITMILGAVLLNVYQQICSEKNTYLCER